MMKYKSSRTSRHAAALVLLGCLAGSVTTSMAQDAQAAGQKVYLDFGCHQCHGYLGQGSQAAPPVPRIAPTTYPFSAFSTLVRTPPRIMPAYSPNILSDAQLRAIYDYMRSIPEPPEVEDIPILRGL
ncbi:MAG: cytochrome c [Proteobacteria bacterium]|jgi:mono/diheme cytochrome c family protein|nr:cytochrome c [Pseudomonadota bacterium]